MGERGFNAWLRLISAGGNKRRTTPVLLGSRVVLQNLLASCLGLHSLFSSFVRFEGIAAHACIEVLALLHHLGRLLVLHLPDAPKIMVPVRTHRRIRRSMDRPARVIMNHRLIVEIHHIQRPIRPHTVLNRPEPQILAANKLRLLTPRFTMRLVSHTIFLNKEVADNVQRRLGGEVAVVPLRGPGTAFIDGATCRSRITANLIDLHIRLLRP